MKSYSIPEDVKEEIREMREDGLYFQNIANYIGVSKTAVMWICDPTNMSKSHKNYYLKVSADPVHKKQRAERLKVYVKRYREKKRLANKKS